MYGHKSPGQALNELMQDRHMSFSAMACTLDLMRSDIVDIVTDKRSLSPGNISKIASLVTGCNKPGDMRSSDREEAEYINCFNAWIKLVHEWELQNTVKGNKNMTTTFVNKAKINQFTTGWAVTLQSGTMDVRIPPSTIVQVIQTNMTCMTLQIGDLTLSVNKSELHRVWPELFPAS